MNTPEEFKEFFEDALTPESIELLLSMVGVDTGLGFKWTIGDVWEWALEHGILYPENKMGWIDRKGIIYGCGHSAHDKLIHDVLRRTVADVEKEGWVRVGLYGKIRCSKKMTRAQIQSLDTMLEKWDKIINKN